MPRNALLWLAPGGARCDPEDAQGFSYRIGDPSEVARLMAIYGYPPKNARLRECVHPWSRVAPFAELLHVRMSPSEVLGTFRDALPECDHWIALYRDEADGSRSWFLKGLGAVVASPADLGLLLMERLPKDVWARVTRSRYDIGDCAYLPTAYQSERRGEPVWLPFDQGAERLERRFVTWLDGSERVLEAIGRELVVCATDEEDLGA